ncbi:MAG: hypothetical protein ACYC96_10210 [Fimbriimonadaceae bacterium]
MNNPNSSRRILGPLVILVAALPACAPAQLSVDPGWDLFQTDPSYTSFMGTNFQGVPLTNFDFGGTIGIQPVSSTDTIVQRTDLASVATAGDTAIVNAKIVALQLKSVIPTTLGGTQALDTYFLTLDPNDASTGTQSITFLSANGGTFDSSLSFTFDILKGSLTGPVVATDALTLTSSGTPWGRNPPTGAVTIVGVNQNLNGTDNGADFWTFGAPTQTPEPFTVGLGIAGFALAVRRRMRAKTPIVN